MWRSLLTLGFSLAVACSSPSGNEGGHRNSSSKGGSGGEAGGDAGEDAGAAGEEISLDLGRACQRTEDCPNGYDCHSAEDAEAELTPAEGYCSISCDDDEDCGELEKQASCVELVAGDETSRICMPGCVLGDESACGMRQALVCWPLEIGKTRACVPFCNHDEQCPEGRVCDARSGLCSLLAQGGGLALGEACDPNELDACANGFCEPLEAGGVCTAYCRRGTFPQCQSDGDASICGWVLAGDEAAGPADLGLCASTCACDRDCAPGLHCVAHPDLKGEARPGLCTVGDEVGIAECS